MSCARCSHALLLAAVRGAERITPSFYFHLWSFSSLSQVFCRIDVVSHYFKVPINPPLEPVYWSISFSPHISKAVWPFSFYSLIFFFFFFAPFFPFRGKCQLLSLLWGWELQRKGEQGMGPHANKRIYILSLMDSDWVNDWGNNSVNILCMRADFCLHLWMNNLLRVSLYPSCNVQHTQPCIWKMLNRWEISLSVCIYVCAMLITLSWYERVPQGSSCCVLNSPEDTRKNALNAQISFQSLFFHSASDRFNSPNKVFITSRVLFMWLVVVVVLWIDRSFIWYLKSPGNDEFSCYIA